MAATRVVPTVPPRASRRPRALFDPQSVGSRLQTLPDSQVASREMPSVHSGAFSPYNVGRTVTLADLPPVEM